MDHRERVTRSTLPGITVYLPLSLLRWVDGQAAEIGVSRTEWIRALIERERVRCGNSPAVESTEEVPT